jgi:outer membrane protein assembly factor BamE
MHQPHVSSLFRAAVLLSVAVLAGCGSLPSVRGVTAAITPYQIDMVQGNVVTREQMDAVAVGMPRAQVRAILGTPLLSSVFHAQRWDYVFSMRRQGAELQSRRVTLFFNGDTLERIEADVLPSESEFVAALRGSSRTGKPPPLEASEEALRKFPVAKPAASAVASPAASTAGVAAPAQAYPPLEPARP